MANVVVEKSWHYDAPTARVWPAMSDSNLFSEIEGQARYQVAEVLLPDGSVERRAKGGKFGPIVKEWTEDLGEWVSERYVRQFRRIDKGAFASIDFVATLTPEGDGCRATVRLEMEPKSLIGRIGAASGMVAKVMTEIAEGTNRMALAELAAPPREGGGALDILARIPFEAPAPAPAVRQRLDELAPRLKEATEDGALVERLCHYLISAPLSLLDRIRPLALARQWQVDERVMVSLCLAAHRLGMLSLRWEVLCPRCRQGRDGVDELTRLPDQVHCSTCNVEFERDFSRNVELLFAPEGWLRELGEGAACMMGAASVPHIKVQRHVPPGGTLDIDPPLQPGAYRLRTTQAGPALEIDWDGGAGFPQVIATGDEIRAGAPAAAGTVQLKNESGRRLTLVIEELAWRRDALTGDRAIALPAFRHYCPEQLLRPGDDVRIANVVLVFTDLKGSTSLYEALGDTAAYKLVRDHFDYLSEIVQRHNGVLVKTIGDAVMAAFSEPEEAVAAALDAQEGVARFNEGQETGAINLKIGLHQGPCIAVTSANVLDYFGSTVNVAARLQGESEGGDIVLSSEMMEAAGVGETLAARPVWQARGETAQLRGIEAPVRFWRLGSR
jgi:class 3 adenylate cyclase